MGGGAGALFFGNDGNGGAGGNANATSTAVDAGDGSVASNALAEGGAGADADAGNPEGSNFTNAGPGGEAKASSAATSTGAGNVTSSANAAGGNGGSSPDNGDFSDAGNGGAGGSGTAVATGSSGSGNVTVSASATGGAGGVVGSGADGNGGSGGGAGASSNATSGGTGNATSSASASGGAGGDQELFAEGDGTGGAGGFADYTRRECQRPIRAMLHPRRVRLARRAVPLASLSLGKRALVVGPRLAAGPLPAVRAAPFLRRWRAVGQAGIRQLRMVSAEAAAPRARQAWLVRRRVWARRHRARAHPVATAAVRTPAVQAATALLLARQSLVAQAPQLHRRAPTGAVEALAAKSISVPAEPVARPQPVALRKAHRAARYHPRTLPEGREVPVEQRSSSPGPAAVASSRQHGDVRRFRGGVIVRERGGRHGWRQYRRFQQPH